MLDDWLCWMMCCVGWLVVLDDVLYWITGCVE